MKFFVGQALLIALLLLGVSVLRSISEYPDYVLPSVGTVFSYLRSGWLALLVEGLRTFGFASIGLLIALSVGAFGALLASRSRIATELALSLGTAWQTYPIIAIIPLLYVLFSDGAVTRLIVIASVAYFPFFLTVLAIGTTRIEAVESFFEQVKWPVGGRLLVRLNHSGRAVENAIIGSGALAVVGALVAEFLVADVGLGAVIRRAQFSHKTEVMIAALITIAAISSLFFPILQRIVRYLIPGAAVRTDNR